MRINNEVLAPRQPIREQQSVAEKEVRERAAKTPEPPPATPRTEGPLGRNLDTQA